jgi:hypothetical protein
MAVTTNLQIHAQVEITGAAPGNITVHRADGCVPTHPAQGQILLTAPLGLLSTGENLKVTTNADGVAGAAVITTVSVLSQTQVRINCFDATGAAVDPFILWASVEVVPRVS